LRRPAKVLAWIGGVLIVPVLIGLVLINSPPGTRFVLNRMLPRINAQLNGRLSYEGAGGSLLRGINLSGVTLRDPEGEVVLRAERVEVGYSIRDILRGRITLGPVLLEKPIVRLLKSHPGEQYSILRVFAKEDKGTDTTSSAVELRIHDITLRDGSILATTWRNPGNPQREGAQQLDTLQLVNVSLQLPLLSYVSGPGEPRAAALEIASGSAWLPDPALELRALSGAAQLLGDSISISLTTVQLPESKLSANAWLVTASDARRFDATADVESLTAGDVASLISGADIPPDWTFQGTLRAASRPSRTVVVASPDLHITAAGGSLRGRVAVVGADNEWTAENSRVTVSGIEVQRLLRAFNVRSTLRATVDGVITASGRSGTADLQVAGLSGYGVRDAVHGYVKASGNLDALSLDTRLAGGVGTVALTGQVAMGKHLRLDRLRGTLERVNLAAVDTALPRSNINARFEGDVVFGSLPREGRLKLYVDSSTIDTVRIDTAVVIATEEEGLLTVDTLFVRAPGLEAKGTGTFGIHEDQNGDFTLTLDAPSLSEVEPLLAALARDTLFDLAGALQARLRAQGALNDYELGLEVHGEDIAVKGFEIESFDAEAKGTPDSLTFGAEAELASDTKLRIGGRRAAQTVAIDSLSIDRGDATWNLDEGATIAMRNGKWTFENAVLRRSEQSGVMTIAGAYPGDLAVTVERLPMVDLVPSSKADSLPDLNGRVNYANGAWKGRVGLALANREPLTVDFTTNPLRGKLTADSFDLATVAPLIAAIRNVGGRIDGSVDVEGSTEAPRLTGQLTLGNVTATVPATGVRYDDIDGTLSFSGDAVTLENVEVAAGKGKAQLAGRVRFARLDRPELDITTRVERFPVMNRRDFIEASATGELRLEGSAGGATLAGNVTVNEGAAFLEKFMRSSGIDLSDPLYAQFVDTTVLRREALSPGLIEAFVDTLRIDNLSVDLGDNFWLRSPDASIQLAGRVAVSTAAQTNNGDTYDVFGTIRAVRGIYRMAFAPGLTREFNIRQGSIRYYGSPKTDANLDLTAEHVVKTATGDRVTITARLGGTMAAPTIALTSDVTPQLSENEIISYLVFGAPTVQAFLGREGGNSERQSVFNRSAEQLVGVLSGKIESAVAGGLGVPIDYFRIKPGEVQSGLAGTELVLGMQVRILGFPSFLRASPRFCPREQLLSLDHVGIDLETRIAPQWGVATTVEPVQGCEAAMSGVSAKPYQFGIDLFWEKR
jgi:autotransporter translocation and assembly factor TamB